MSCAESIGEIYKQGCCESAAIKIWRDDFDNLDDLKNNNNESKQFVQGAFLLKVDSGTFLLIEAWDIVRQDIDEHFIG